MTFDQKDGTIGRSPSNDLVLPDPNRYISRQHAKILHKNGCYYLQDTSFNGIYILNKSLHLHKNSLKLENGDKLVIGDYELIVILHIHWSESVSSTDDQTLVFPDHRPENPLKKPTITIPEDFDFEELLTDDEENECEFLYAQPAGAPIQRSTKTVQFTSYFPTEIKPGIWYTLLTYIHFSNLRDAVREDVENRLSLKIRDYKGRYEEATNTVARGAEIVVIPELSGCRFNPPRASVLWLEDWQRVEFRMQAIEGFSGLELNTAKNGRISFYVGPILIAEINIWAYLTDEKASTYSENLKTNCTSNPYNAVFVSYSHNDKIIIQILEKAYAALGMKYLRDVNILRSGEKWNRSLLKKIEEANIFQLCWSKSAKESAFVEQEWRYALNLQRQSFIRPVY